MTTFVIEATKPTGETVGFLYNNHTSELTDTDGRPVDLSHLPQSWLGDTYTTASEINKSKPAKKVSAIRVLKIQLGLSCNYSCEYCSQRFVPHAEQTNKNDVGAFMEQLEQWFDGGVDGRGEGVQVQFWGGEPFVYWKTLKPLAERIKQRYPNVAFWMPTNGSLLDDEKNEWLDRLGFSISISHDGPGQHVRGPDPFQEEKGRAAILDLFARLHPKGRMSFNAVMNRHNMSRSAVVAFFQKVTGAVDVQVGEGAFIDSYDEGGLSESLSSSEEHVAFRCIAIEEIRSQALRPENSNILRTKVGEFIRTVMNRKPASAIGQKCGMDKPDRIAVDLNGNVLTCQNISAVAIAPNGKPHKIGHVSDLESVALNTATSWHGRENCRQCPVIQLCGGSCMFLEGQLWDVSCDNSYSDNIVFFAWAFEVMTGCKPIRITGGNLPLDRQELWIAVNKKPTKKVIPIKVAK